MRIRSIIAIAIAIAAVAAAPIAFTASAAHAAVPGEKLSQCDGDKTVAIGKGYEIKTPGVWESTSVNCNLKYGDLPHRNPAIKFGAPAQAIKGLQQNLNFCYGAKLVVDGKYGAKTRDAIRVAQSKHGITVDGIYGPKTRSAINWRSYNPTKNVWSKTCSSPI